MFTVGNKACFDLESAISTNKRSWDGYRPPYMYPSLKAYSLVSTIKTNKAKNSLLG